MPELAPRKSLEPWISDSITYYKHQVEGIRILARWRSFILADDMGLGKSLQTLTVFVIDVVLGWSNVMLIICPASLKGNWADEIEKFTEGIPYIILEGSPREREVQLVTFEQIEGPKILILNYELVEKHLERLNLIKPDITVFDEAHYLKNPSSKRTKAAHALNGRRRFMLTGTPLLNQTNELWSLLHMVEPQKYPKYWPFVNRYCNTPDAPIWMADGSFKSIGEITDGDCVMGWSEGYEKSRRTIMPSFVERVERRIAPELVRVTLNSGRIIKCTPDHLWLSASHNPDFEYCPVISRERGRLAGLSFVVDTALASPTQEQLTAASWLAGIYDGEGSNNFIAQSRSYNPEIYKRITESLDILEISYTETDTGVRLRGGRATWVKMLTWGKPVKSEFFQKRLWTQLNRTKDRVVKVESLGPGEVVSMKTTSGNYVAWGYASKNCAFGGFQGKQIVGPANEKELRDRLSGVMLRRIQEDVLDLPEVQIIERRVDLLPEQRRLYDQVFNELLLPMPDEADPVAIENALVKFLRLKQICGTTKPFTGVDVSAKLDLATTDDCELLSNGHRIVQFTQFRAVQSAYLERMSSAGFPLYELNGSVPQHLRNGVIKDWAANPAPGVLVCILRVAGLGLNGMQVSRHGSFIDEDFVPGINDQGIARLKRIGAATGYSIQIRKYIARNTIESRIQAILRNKRRVFKDIIESDAGWKAKLYRALIEEEIAA